MNSWGVDGFGGSFDESINKQILEALAVGDPVFHVVVEEMTGEEFRREIECDWAIKCGISDRDMLLLQIDWALDAGDEELFRMLAAEL